MTRLYVDKQIIVTGGAGFIGSCVIRELNNRGFDNIIVVDRLGSDDRWKNLVGKKFRDIIDKDQFFNYIEGNETDVQAIIHLGACSSTLETDATYLLENNYRYSVKLAEIAFKYNLRFIYASSAATYGSGIQGFLDDHDQLDALAPLNMYGYSKHLFDLWLFREKALDRCVGLKYFNVFGPNEYHKGRMASALLHFLEQVQKTGSIKLFASDAPDLIENGEQKRDFIYVKDAARMTCAFLENEACGIFNIGSGIASSWNTLAYALFTALNRPVSIEYIPMPADLLGKYQSYTCANMNKTKKSIGAIASCLPITEAVTDYLSNFLIKGERW